MLAVNDTNRVLRLNAIAVGLVSVPLIIISVMAVRTIVNDKEASQALAGEAARQVASSYAVQLQTAIAPIVSARLDKVQTALSSVDDYVGFLRRMVHAQSPPFVALYESGRRVFPPEDNAALLFQERQYLAQIESAVTSALENASGKETESTWARLMDEPALITCGNVGTDRALCIASTLGELRRHVDSVFSKTTDDIRQPVELFDPWGKRQWPTRERMAVSNPSAGLELANSFSGWKIRVGVDTKTGSTALLVLAVVIPVTVAWGLALISLVRFQSETARQHRVRAESAARLSHDLRTPIANLALYVDLVARHGKDSPSIQRSCTALEQEIERLAFIADCTVRHSRGLQPQQTTSAPVKADRVVGNILTRYEPLMAKSGCTLSFDAGAPAAVVDDQTALERILINLIDNARSHAGGANVKVSTRPSADGLVLTIVDDGPRSNPVPHERSKGHGLGLEVVEELVRSRGGKFSAFIESAGSRFEVALPSARAALS